MKHHIDNKQLQIFVIFSLTENAQSLFSDFSQNSTHGFHAHV